MNNQILNHDLTGLAWELLDEMSEMEYASVTDLFIAYFKRANAIISINSSIDMLGEPQDSEPHKFWLIYSKNNQWVIRGNGTEEPTGIVNYIDIKID